MDVIQLKYFLQEYDLENEDIFMFCNSINLFVVDSLFVAKQNKQLSINCLFIVFLDDNLMNVVQRQKYSLREIKWYHLFIIVGCYTNNCFLFVCFGVFFIYSKKNGFMF